MRSVVTARSGIAARASARRREVALGGVAAVHARQRAVAPRLQRQVQVLAHRRALGHRRDRLGPEVLRVRRREADAVDAVDRVERAQQVGELRAVLPGAEVAAVGVDVLAEHGDLAHAVGGELLDLVDDVAHAPADLGTAHDRHDAERARVVAADLDGDPRRVRDARAGPAAPTGTPRAPRGSRPPGPRAGPARAASAACARLWVPNTTSTWPARSTISSRSFWARQPPTAIWRSGRSAFSALSRPRWP